MSADDKLLTCALFICIIGVTDFFSSEIHMLILNANEVRQAMPMDQTIAVMKDAYAALSDGRAVVPLRTRLMIEPHQAVSLFMPAYVQ